jgi:hypothetical protein
LFLAGAALAIGAGLAGEYGWLDYGVHDWWRASPLSFVQRFGSVLLLLSLVATIGHYVTRLSPPLQGLAEESLLVYAVHVALLYGSLWTVGLGPHLGPQPPGVVLLWVLVMLAAMTALALGWNNVERLHPRLAAACRAVTVVALVSPLL